MAAMKAYCEFVIPYLDDIFIKSEYCDQHENLVKYALEKICILALLSVKKRMNFPYRQIIDGTIIDKS